MKKLIAYLFVVFPLFGWAQSLSIEELWDAALESARNHKAETAVHLNKAALKGIRTGRLPVISAETSLQNNLLLPRTPVPEILFNPNANPGEMTTLQFATRWASNAGILAEWPLFNPSQKSKEKATELDVQIAEVQKQKDLQTWRSGAILAYTGILLATQQYELARQDSIQFQEILTLTEQRVEKGRDPSENYLNALQEAERKRIRLQEAYAVWIESKLELRKYLSIGDSPSLSSNMQDIQHFLKSIKKIDFDQQLNQFETEKRKNEGVSVKREQLPSLSFKSYLGQQLYTSSLSRVQGRSIHGYSYLALSLSIPISGHLTGNTKAKEFLYAEKIAELNEREHLHINNLENKQVKAKLTFLEEKITGLQKIKNLSLQNRDHKREAYLAGRILLTELNQAEQQVQLNRQEIWQAEYELIQLLLQ